MASSKVLLAVILVLGVAFANAEDSISSSESPMEEHTVNKDSSVLYHLLEGRKHKQEPASYNYHDHAESKKVHFVTSSYPKDYDNKPKTEGVRTVSIVPNPHYLPSPYVNDDTHMHYQSTTASPLTTAPEYTSHNPCRKVCPCRCGAMPSYSRNLPTTHGNQLSEQPYDLGTEQTAYYEQMPQNHYRRKEPSRNNILACGDRKLRRVKHVIIRKNDSPRDKKNVDDTLVETQ